MRFAPIALVVSIVASSSIISAQEVATTRSAIASALAIAAYEEWFGPRVVNSIPSDRLSRWDSARSMSIESAVAFALAREWFAHFAKDDRASVDGLAWYLQSRVVERAFDRTFLAPGYRFYSTCFFGCQVPWSFRPLIVGRWHDGLGRPEFVRTWSGREWPVLDRRPATGFDRRSLAMALAFGSLERELGWPTLQGALRVAAHAKDGRQLADILEDATARELDAVFRITAGAPADFHLGGMTTTAATTCGSQPCYLTTVPVASGGESPFPLVLRVDFEDDSHVDAVWKGDDEIFEFESASPAVRARLDPDRIWLLDRDYANNDNNRTGSTSSLSAKWIAQWMLWVQDAMLTYTFPV
jgi:hypothetical protein